MTTRCCKCGNDINPHDVSSWKEVKGFVGGPKKDSMAMREDTGNYACTPCIHKMRAGQAPEQDSLLDDVPPVHPEHEAIMRDIEANSERG